MTKSIINLRCEGPILCKGTIFIRKEIREKGVEVNVLFERKGLDTAKEMIKNLFGNKKDLSLRAEDWVKTIVNVEGYSIKSESLINNIKTIVNASTKSSLQTLSVNLVGDEISELRELKLFVEKAGSLKAGCLDAKSLDVATGDDLKTALQLFSGDENIFKHLTNSKSQNELISLCNVVADLQNLGTIDEDKFKQNKRLGKIIDKLMALIKDESKKTVPETKVNLTNNNKIEIKFDDEEINSEHQNVLTPNANTNTRKLSGDEPEIQEQEEINISIGEKKQPSSLNASEFNGAIPLNSAVPILSATSSASTISSANNTSLDSTEWTEFHQQALKNGGYFNLTNDIEMKIDDVCSWLASSPAGVSGLLLSNCKLTDADLVKLNAVLKDNKTISEVDFHYTNLDVVAFAEVLEVNRTIKKITINLIDINEEGAKALAAALKVNSAVNDLNLYRCALGDEGVKALAEVLKDNAAITAINLGCNNIGNAGVVALAEALEYNKTIRSLDLEDIVIYKSGVAALVEAMNVNKTIVDINFSIKLPKIQAALEKNRQLLIKEAANALKEKEAKAALELINSALSQASTDSIMSTEDSLFYPREVMDQIVDQMAQAGLEDDIINLAKLIKSS